MECIIVSGFRTAVQPCFGRICNFQVNLSALPAKKLKKLNRVLIGNSPATYGRWRMSCMPVSLEEEFSVLQSDNFSKDEDTASDILPEEAFERPPSSEELTSIDAFQLNVLLADSERSKLIKKLSEANQQNRFLKRQLQVKEDALINFKSKLAVIEFEIQALVNLGKEIMSYDIPDCSRKINGKYIQSHLLSRLEAVQEKLEGQIEDVDAAQSQEVPLFWHGVAENVQVMGSFDGWSEGEHLSPEYTGSYTTFSTTLMLRPGRYEIKFLVDGEWQLSPKFPTVGEGLMQNNLLIVE
ncbi:hypothetical protein OROGR_023671 [Orobanche gracilis]